MKKIIQFLCLLCVTLLFACSHKTIQYVSVDAIGSEDYQRNVQKKNIYFEQKNADNGINNLIYEEMYPHIEGAFFLNGMNVVKDKKKADYIACIDFGVKKSEKIRKIIEQPRYEVIDYYPVWYTNIYGRSFYPYYYEPIIARTGSNYYEREYEVFPKYLLIAIYNYEKKKIGKLEWQVELIDASQSNDFRRAIPTLIAPLARFIHEDTRGKKTVRIEFDQYQNVIVEDVNR